MIDYCPPTDKLSKNTTYLRSRASIMRDSDFAFEVEALEAKLAHINNINDIKCSQYKIYKYEDFTPFQNSHQIISDTNKLFGDFFSFNIKIATITYKNIAIDVHLNKEEQILFLVDVKASDICDNHIEDALFTRLAFENHKQQLSKDILYNQLNPIDTPIINNNSDQKRLILTSLGLYASQSCDETRLPLEGQIIITMKRTHVSSIPTSDVSRPFCLSERTRLSTAFMKCPSPHFYADGVLLR